MAKKGFYVFYKKSNAPDFAFFRTYKEAFEVFELWRSKKLFPQIISSRSLGTFLKKKRGAKTAPQLLSNHGV